MWSNGFQRRIDLAAPDGGAAALLILLPSAAAAGAAWLYLADLLPRLLGLLGLLLLGLALAWREAGVLSRRRVVRAVLGERACWELCTAAGNCIGGRLVHGWELRGAGRHGLIGLGWSTPAGYHYLLAFTAALPPAAVRRLRVHRRLAASAESAKLVTLRRGQSVADSPIGGPDPRQ
jgi:hypothetical protein